MLSKSQIKLINSLKQKKYRTKNSLFVAEGEKTVFDLLNSSLNVKTIFCTKKLLQNINTNKNVEIIESSKSDLSKISFLKNSSDIVALIKIPELEINYNELTENISIALDTIQDPGNLGTIIRMADWFGITNIYCSKDTVDLYNPKVVQATMGAIAKVKVHYVDLAEMFSKITDIEGFNIYGSFLEGDSIYETNLDNKGIILMGNEGKGISKELEKFVNQKLYIPKFYKEEIGSESLNVSVATSIIVSEFIRRNK